MSEELKPHKTYKRETAIVMLVFLGVMFSFGIYNEAARAIGEFLTLPIFGFAGGAFTIDAAIKQGGYKRAG